MLEILNEVIEGRKQFECATKRWLDKLNPEEKEALLKIKQMHSEDPSKINITNLYNKLQKATDLPFKLTNFRDHFGDRCTCRTA